MDRPALIERQQKQTTTIDPSIRQSIHQFRPIDPTIDSNPKPILSN